MNLFLEGLTQYLTKSQIAAISQIKVGIAGVGGLGSNVAVNLVRTGFSRLVLIDFDVVEASNLNRQFYFREQLGKPKVLALQDNLLQINADLNLEVHQIRVEASNLNQLLGDCQIIVEAFDQPGAKQLLVEHFWKSPKLLVAVSGIAGWRNAERIKTRYLKENICLIGDGETAVDELNPPLAPLVSLAAAKQASVVLEYVLNQLVAKDDGQMGGSSCGKNLADY